MIKQVFKSFPDNKPISGLCIVEDITKCPTGYNPISKTHDQDSDADLHMQSWKESVFIGRKITRYLCLSKTEGISDYIVVNINIINEKECPPDGYCLIPRTIDSDQKAWRKRQLCYKLTRKSQAAYAITDIILLSRSKKAPDGFNLVGDLNGLTLCYKTSPQSPNNVPLPSLTYGLAPTPPTENIPNNNGSLSSLPSLESSANALSHDYDRLMSLKPTRPAPKLPPTYSSSNYSTLNSYQGLEGIPFILNQNISMDNNSIFKDIPEIKIKTAEEIDLEYNYSFEQERQV
ncbi:multivesicular body subunit 12B [Melanaphis sacchari]|uniref:Multivesicular body subunit 12A n=1 Tax=Melanaphis sacchari TaxID=742174 RepID=A0A2H8TLX8_9HEMI|nr:multivesicular body subunit 12B [Melanaphis sacchari]